MLLMIDARPVLRHSDQKFARRPQVYRRFALGAYRGASSLARGAAGPTGCAGEPSELFTCLLSALISASAMAGQVEARRRARTAPGQNRTITEDSFAAVWAHARGSVNGALLLVGRQAGSSQVRFNRLGPESRE